MFENFSLMYDAAPLVLVGAAVGAAASVAQGGRGRQSRRMLTGAKYGAAAGAVVAVALPVLGYDVTDIVPEAVMDSFGSPPQLDATPASASAGFVAAQ